MFLRDPSIQPDQAYSRGTAAMLLGVEGDDLQDWLDSNQLVLQTFALPDGRIRLPGQAILDLVSGKTAQIEAITISDRSGPSGLTGSRPKGSHTIPKKHKSKTGRTARTKPGKSGPPDGR